MKIGLDIMGGDNAPAVTVLGAIEAQKELRSGITQVLIGDQKIILEILNRENFDASVFEIVHAPEVITFNDHPTRALSAKPDSSIAKGFRLLKDGKINAFSGAGNTGAMLVGSIYSVSTIPGVIRPCITSILPKVNGKMGILLDVGANADCKADVLYQWAILGSIYSEFVYGINNPRVGLLSIGEEAEKGNILTQATHKLMKDSSDFNFIGNVEGRDLFSPDVDVIVTDGFTGNILLKNVEGIYTLLKKRKIDDDYINSWNYELYGGTPVLGINGNVIIGHGISNVAAIKSMINLAVQVVDAKLTSKITEALSKVVMSNG